MPKDGSSKFDLIPDSSIEALADRFALGQENYKEKAWNAFTNQEMLDNQEWINERIKHGVVHLLHFQAVMEGRREDDGDDDGAAIMWLGSMLHSAWLRRKALKDATSGNPR